jgi:hypothetical protein
METLHLHLWQDLHLMLGGGTWMLDGGDLETTRMGRGGMRGGNPEVDA